MFVLHAHFIKQQMQQAVVSNKLKMVSPPLMFHDKKEMLLYETWPSILTHHVTRADIRKEEDYP